MIFLIIMLVVAVIILFMYIINLKKEIKAVSSEIKKNHSEYRNIRIKTTDRHIEQLVVNINKLYDENQKVNVKKKEVELELKQSIENMAHDLRTPLTSIMGYIQLIKDEEVTEEEKSKYIDIVEKRTNVLQTLITSFYDLSRIEGNEYNFNLSKINLANVLCENIALFYNEFAEKFMEPIIEIQENTSYIISDKNAINRVFSNLISNILKYGDKYTKIILKEEDEFIITEFINYAPNLVQEDINKMFERFFTANKSRSDKNTGLGLSITKAFVENLGNNIEAKLLNENLVISISWRK
ncbi:sensor histidine kinase [Clostridium gasigenes]|uniref:sensor histidine kinase n=1 Tax=Clostridium gasigenes TaxID=94869 RepID=UPI001C0B6678|nr:HAMP domain-containing sensor histidine kinase [Clostridium gasigenes]MBU3103326.1 HAMP domain-containing histidine kinase [Clostridium gasigenes]MBU3133324.1 HAMP domain-containing histidine kinase [Clostridium gasigenes]MBU3137381.1 HAMP domain-containing histidine kinase [Clostridium gasigenes]